MTDQPEFEELEQIPWAALAAKPADPRARYGAVAAVLLVAIGVGAWLTMRDSASPPAPATTLASMAPLTTSLPATTTPVVAAPPSTVAVYSEADLMLIDIGDEERLAAMHAEWLVRDLLTVDGDPVVSERIDGLLPNAERGEAESYVEWVEVATVDSSEPGQYRVEVVYRVLIGGDDGFVREPAAAMAVELALDVDGSARLLAMPESVAVPTLDGIAGD